MGVNASFLNYYANQGTALFSIASPPGGQDDWYVGKSDGSFADIGPLTPPANGAAGTQNTPVEAATPDLSHVVWDPSGQHGSGGYWPFDSTLGRSSLYEYSGTGNSQPLLVGVSGGPGSTDLISVCGTSAGRGVAYAGASGLSVDGRTLYFTASQCSSGSGANANTQVPANTLYARIDNGTPAAHTVLISGRSPSGCVTPSCLTSPPRDAAFQRFSFDGSKAVFTSTQQLTDTGSEDSQSGDTGAQCENTTGPNGCNLYLYDFAQPAGPELTAVSAGDSSGGGPRVQGVVAMSPDGSHVYFVAKGVLTGAANNQEQTATDGSENLYVYERDASFPAGHLAFIGALSAANIGFLGSDQQINWHNPTANVTPDGRFLVFASHARLTSDPPSTSGAAQLFRYDAQTGQLLRLSLGQGGFNDNGNSGRGNVTIVPVFNSLTRTNPTMSDDGSYVFFQSPVALTPRALDDVPIDSGGDFAQNVYEWHNGQVSLISDARDTSATNTLPCGTWQVINEGEVSSVCLMGTNPSGSDVFFTTNDPLVPQDTDTTQLDIYDARICTAESPCIKQSPPLPPCLGEACHGIPSPTPSNLAPGTSSFNGEGNVTPPASKPPVKVNKCKKGFVKAKGKCIKRKKPKKARKAKKAKRATNDRRATR
jgi:hypothetical protein